MTLVPCTLCKSQIACIYSLNVHYKYCHPSVTKYVCHVGNCFRKFDSWNSFRKHLISTHDIPLRESSDQNEIPEGSNQDIFFPVMGEGSPGQECSSKSVFSLSKFQTLLKDAVSKLTAKFLSMPGIPRNFVDIIINAVTSFLSDKYMLLLQDFILGLLSEESKSDVQSAFDLLAYPFEHLQTEYLRFQYFQSCGDYFPPVAYDIFKRPERVFTKQGEKLVMKSVTGQLFPIVDILKKYMELPNVLSKSLDYVRSIESENVLVSFLQCSAWRRKRDKFASDATVLPIHVYYDDFEPNNPLGPHCEKLGVVYLQLPFLPPECQSKLDNILTALLFNTDDRVSYGNEAVFKPLIKALTKLEQGIWINNNGVPLQVFFVTGLLLGDNLGLNGMCGFVECFTANYPCRICKVYKQDLFYLYTENPALLRTRDNYLMDVEVNDSSKTGIKEKCIFDHIPSFETPTDISVDCFHDSDEGVSHYVMVPVLLHFHKVIPNFIERLNQRLYMVNLGVDNDKRPPSIDVERLKKSKKLKMTGSEMLTFVRIFGSLVVDLVPVDDSFYQLYLLLHDVVSIIHAKILTEECAVILGCLVTELNRLYVHLSGETLKPKHHILTHYERLLVLHGPSGNLSTIRMEAKHKFLKAISNVCVCRKNLPKTVAIKLQLNLCFKFMCNESVVPETIFGPGQMVDLSEHECFKSFKRTLPPEFSENTPFFCPRWIDYKGTKYSRENVLITGFSSESGCPFFSEVQIILPHADSVYFICSRLCTIGYYSEVRGYQVERVPEYSVQWFCIKQDQLVDYHPLSIIQTGRGELVIILKTFL